MRSLIFIISLALFFSSPWISFAEDPRPVAVIDRPEYDFGSILEGEKVAHEFKVRNTGKAPLLIERVKTGWGCATASYTEEIPPGGEGNIKVIISTDKRGGRELSRSTRVFTNDPATPGFTLLIKGMVDRPFTLTPKRASLTGFIGEQINTRVSLVPNRKYPFEIINSYVERVGLFKYEIQKQENGYLLVFDNLKKTPGRYREDLHLVTNNPRIPEIRVRVIGNLKAPAE